MDQLAKRDRTLRCILGFALAPAVFPAAFAVSEYLIPKAAGGFATAQVMALFTYPVALILGVPLHLAMRRWGYKSAHHYAIGGAALGATPILFWPLLGTTIFPAFSIAALGLFIGAVSASLFWALAVRTLRDAA